MALHGLGKETAQWSQAERTVQKSVQVSSAPYSNFSFPLLLSFYLADFCCLASHIKAVSVGHCINCFAYPYIPDGKLLWPGLTHVVSPRHSRLWFWVCCYDILAINIIPTLFFPTLLPLAQLIWRNLFSQRRTGVAGSSLNELFRNVAASFPTQKPVILSQNSCTPR